MLDIKANLEQKAKFAKLKANQDALDACPKHRFQIPKVLSLGTAVQCEHCKGAMQIIHAYSYTKGYQAAGGNPTDIMPTWYEVFDKEQQANSIVKGDGFKNEDATE